MSDHAGYTLGWTCANGTERVAAESFLDEKHNGPDYISTNDNNDYTLGRIGKHKVAIAVLPDGEYGSSSAAETARDMLHTFPNVRIGLMVGIGGGAPSQSHDIRLGDVVSTTRNGKGSVFQYDFGKAIQEKQFDTTGILNQPPLLLRAAVSGLRSQHELEGNCVEDAINKVLKKCPRLRKKYRRPETASDRLFRSDSIHGSGERLSCETNCMSNPAVLVERRDRTDKDDDPTIHYGIIASGDRLMRDAIIRDRLALEKDVLCFEMEAAGLMNHFPCLVIRGICDYADSHASQTWQGYAAMTAAAYAKELLLRIPVNRIEDEGRIARYRKI